jgi:hypothetical protein
MNNPTNLAKIAFHVPNEDGTEEFETLWATSLGNNLYKLDNSPFFAYNVSWEDTVEAQKKGADGFPVFKRVVEKSGNRTIRIIFDPPVAEGNESRLMLDQLVALGCSYEGANHTYIAITVPPTVDLWQIRDFLISSTMEWEHADPSYRVLFPDEE